MPLQNSAVSSQGNRKKKKNKEKYEANGVVTDDISSLKVKNAFLRNAFLSTVQFGIVLKN